MVTIIVGALGSGKTSLLKNRFLKKTKKQKLCYALMQQDLGDYTYIRDFREYIEQGVKMKDVLFVVDEAVTAVPKKQPDPTKKKFDRELLTWLLNSRKCNNVIFFIFHALQDIPVWLLKYSTFIIRFDTVDQMNFQKTRFASFPTLVNSIKTNPRIPKYQYDEIKIG